MSDARVRTPGAGLRIRIVTPAAPASRTGNRTTALRWARLFGELGHRVRIANDYLRGDADVLVALHARKSAGAIRRFREQCPTRACIVALTGTDLYEDIERDPRVVESLTLADAIVVLQQAAMDTLPAALRNKAHVVYQSAVAPRRRPPRRHDRFEVCLIASLRAVKDPLVCARAVRDLPSESLLHVVHAGPALDEGLAAAARQEQADNPRYEWLGPVTHTRAVGLLARSRLVVHPSRSEGGANVVMEALACGVPILATRIPGAVGILGPDYPGYFEVGDARALRRLLLRAERDLEFYNLLTRRAHERAFLADPVRERDALVEVTAVALDHAAAREQGGGRWQLQRTVDSS